MPDPGVRLVPVNREAIGADRSSTVAIGFGHASVAWSPFRAQHVAGLPLELTANTR